MGDVDILAPSDRRRVRTVHEKAALLAETDAEGGMVRLVARQHNISESLLYNWRSARKAAAVAMGAPKNVEFVPAGIIEGPASRGMSVVIPATPEGLEKGRFVWPPIINDAMTLTPAGLSVVIEARDWRRTIAPSAPAQPTLI